MLTGNRAITKVFWLYIIVVIILTFTIGLLFVATSRLPQSLNPTAPSPLLLGSFLLLIFVAIALVIIFVAAHILIITFFKQEIPTPIMKINTSIVIWVYALAILFQTVLSLNIYYINIGAFFATIAPIYYIYTAKKEVLTLGQ